MVVSFDSLTVDSVVFTTTEGSILDLNLYEDFGPIQKHYIIAYFLISVHCTSENLPIKGFKGLTVMQLTAYRQIPSKFCGFL